ncbi:MAG: GntR family transcriptional regulator [Phycisphaeraceae bacterium]|nr:GntR family transcriptional regulator [Phycisphaeraceae bacterium]
MIPPTLNLSTTTLRRTAAQQAKADLLRLIEENQIQPGGQLPSEIELAKRLGVARQTLRGALEHLAQQDVLERRHGVGTFVKSATRVGTIGLITAFCTAGRQKSIYNLWMTHHA